MALIYTGIVVYDQAALMLRQLDAKVRLRDSVFDEQEANDKCYFQVIYVIYILYYL